MVGLVLAVAACDGATPPERPAPYDYTIRPRGGLPLSFRWPESSLPVRIWVQPGTDLRYVVEAAIDEWEETALYGEFRGVIVTDSLRADVRVALGSPFSSDSSVARSCGGSTRIDVGLDTAIVLPFPITLRPRLSAESSDLAECFMLVATHELGHALGLFLHSDDPEDLMHDRPSLAGMSARDQATFATLYHSPVSVRLPPGR